MKYKELFKEIKDVDTPLGFLKFLRVGRTTKINVDPQYLDYEDFDNEQETDFEKYIKRCLEKANYTPGEYEFKLIQLLLESLINRRLLGQEVHSYAVDLIIASALLHNVYIDKEHPYTSIFKAREEFLPISDEKEFRTIPKDYLDILFSTIEKQFGEQSLIKDMIPLNGTPTDLFANCVWLVRESGFIK